MIERFHLALRPPVFWGDGPIRGKEEDPTREKVQILYLYYPRVRRIGDDARGKT